MALARRRRHTPGRSSPVPAHAGSRYRSGAGRGNAARAAALTTGPDVDDGQSLVWAQGAMADLDVSEVPGGGDPVTQISLQFHVTRPEDASGENTVKAGQSFSDATQYVEVDTGRTLWLDVSSLDGAGRDALEMQLSRSGGIVRIDPRSGAIVVGQRTTERSLEADTRSARAVLDDANARGSDWGAAAAWAFLNGGSTALEASEASDAAAVGSQDKPGAWYNHYRQDESGAVQSHTSRNDRSGTDAPALDEAGLRRVIMACLDVNGVRAALGDDQEMFRAGLKNRFGKGHPLGGSGLDWLIDELWSYLQTGAGTDGKIDIGRLQALARALGADTAESADTNTPFRGAAFAVGETGHELARGDGLFGRATMLSLMHLVGSIEETVVEPLSVRLVPADLFHEEDRFLIDWSGSMVGSDQKSGKWGPVSSAVSEAMGWTQEDLMGRKVGELRERSLRVDGSWETDLELSLERAYRILHPTDSREDRASFAALFGLEPQYIFSETGLDAARLRREIGDEGTGSRRSRAYGAAGESGLKGFLTVLTQPELLPEGDPLRLQLEGGSRAPGEDGARLNAVVDEPEQSPEYLRVVQALAEALDVDVRFIAVPTRSSLGKSVSHLQFIDIGDISIDKDGKATVRYTQAGMEQTRTVDLEGHRPGGLGGEFENARLPLHRKQEIMGVTN